jgi:dolichol kinase
LLLAVWVLLHCRLAVGLGNWGVRRNVATRLVCRKFVHLAATGTVLYWPWYCAQDGWSYRLNTLAGTLYSAQILAQGLLFPNVSDPEVKAMSRTGNPRELLVGPLVFGLALCYVGHRAFRREMATYLMSALGFGDGLAPLAAGLLGGRGQYRSFLGGDFKSLSGSLGMFLGTLLGYHVLSGVLGAPETVDPGRLVGMTAAATLAEAVSGMYDNLAIVLAVLLSVNATGLLTR